MKGFYIRGHFFLIAPAIVLQGDYLEAYPVLCGSQHLH
jgi:hypothetical protein